jgi:PTH1 family peptidyl-tRNA hydrolase
MKLLVGLGNPGKKYEKTRHNLGFMVVEKLAESLELEGWKYNKKFNSEILTQNSKLILAKPQTMMNASGFAVAKMANFYKIKPQNIWVVHDEVDLPLGKVKIIEGRGAAGHRGVMSIIEQLGTVDFVRFRLGIGHLKRKGKWTEDFVLSAFLPTEKSEVKRLIKKTVEMIELALEKGIGKAMSWFC